MHWLRIDRYYRGRRRTTRRIPFPARAVHALRKRPCEYVCPVEATVHSAEGLNDMVYNRCVGTRFCSNNCPYKVRRFNFLAYADFKTPSRRLQYNPEVTVRSRGVMEKCTYCVQRIRHAEIDAETEERPLADGEVADRLPGRLPVQAIVFGDMNDPQSKVKQCEGLAAALRAAGRPEHESADDLPGGIAESQPGTRGVASMATRARRRPADEPQADARRRRPAELRARPATTSRSVTEKISDLVLTRPTGLGLAGLLRLQPRRWCSCSSVAVAYLLVDGRRHLGHPDPDRLGLRHHRLRVVDRHRPRRHADLGLPAADAPEMADLDQPHRRGHDHLRRDVRGHVSRCCTWAGRGSSTGCCPTPTRWTLWPQFRSALVWDVFAVSTYFTVSLVVLVHGHDSRPGHAARPRHEPPGRRSSTACWPWAGATRPGTGTASRWPTCCWAGWPPRW